MRNPGLNILGRFAATRFSMVGLLLNIGSFVGCAPADRTSPGHRFTPSTVSAAGFSRSLVSRQKQFVAYVPNAQLLTVIDPQNLNLIWSSKVGAGYYGAVPLYDLEGAAPTSGVIEAYALAGPGALKLFANGAQRDFDIYGLAANSSWSVARSAPTMAFSSEDGLKYTVLKSIGGGEWQSLQFDAVQTSAVSVSGVILSDDGNTMFTVSSPTGSFEVWQSSGSPAIYTQPTLTCKYTTTDWRVETKFIGGMITSSSSTALVFDDQNLLHALDITATSCPKSDDWSSVTTSNQVRTLFEISADTFLAGLADGRINIINLNGLTLQVDQTIETPCTNAAESVDAIAAGPNGALYVKCASTVATYRNFADRDQRQLLATVSFNATTALSPSIDQLTGRAYWLENGGLGTVRAAQLETGNVETRTGLFLEQIFKY